jgi:hypothetical protein
MKQNDATPRGSRVRERASFSYKASTSEPDLKEQIRKLKAMRNSPYWNRSEADIAGMILLEHVPKEIEKYEQTEGKRGIARKKKTNEE